jgi:hypothetical protein
MRNEKRETRSEKWETERAKIYMRVFEPRISSLLGNDFGPHSNGSSNSILESEILYRTLSWMKQLENLRILFQDSWEVLLETVIIDFSLWVPIDLDIIDIISRICSAPQTIDIFFQQSIEFLPDNFENELSIYNQIYIVLDLSKCSFQS